MTIRKPSRRAGWLTVKAPYPVAAALLDDQLADRLALHARELVAIHLALVDAFGSPVAVVVDDDDDGEGGDDE